MGKNIVEIEKGMKDIQAEVNSSVYSAPADRGGYSDHRWPAAPRFEPPKSSNAEAADETNPAHVG
jgi:hypothetical protein